MSFKNLFYKRFVFYALTGTVSFCLLFPPCTTLAGQQTLNVAAASNLTYVIPELIKAFEEEQPGIHIRLSLASTGNIYSQIINGAPFDIFLAADQKRPYLLYESGLTIGKSFTYARGSLVMWSSEKRNFVEGLYALSSPTYKRIAMANPKHAPYGEAAMMALKNAGLWEVLKPKLIYGENVSQTAQFVKSGSAQAGFIPESMMKNEAMKDGSAYPLPEETYPVIMQQGVIVKRKRMDSKSAFLFKDFLFSEKAKKIMKEFGYRVD